MMERRKWPENILHWLLQEEGEGNHLSNVNSINGQCKKNYLEEDAWESRERILASENDQSGEKRKRGNLVMTI